MSSPPATHTLRVLRIRGLFALPLLFCLLTQPPSGFAQQPSDSPVNPDATAQARDLLRSLDSISGETILSGEHNYPNTISRYSDRVLDLTGKFPAIFGQDFGFAGGDDKDSTLSRPAMIREVIRQYRAGAIPALCWHAVPPTEDEPVIFQDSILSRLSDWEFQQLLTPGTELHARWERQVDRIAGYLRELQDAGVPVLFRPYHEMNGNWFWWGGRPGNRGTEALYRMLFDRYVHVHHLNNLLWVWNVAAASSKSGTPSLYWPGARYVDVVTMDIYRPFTDADYQSIVQLAGTDKPMALAEVGTLPTLETLARQPRWTYFMVWSEFAEDHNTLEGLRTVFTSPHVASRGDLTFLESRPATQATTPPKDLQATAAAATALNSLKGPDPKLVEVNASSLTAQELQTHFRAIYAANEYPLVRWTPASPTGSAGKLDAFEWSQLRQPGSALRDAWIKEIDELCAKLRSAGTSPVFLSALPGTPGPKWWNEPGANGTQALLRDLNTVLSADGMHNLLRIWEAGTVVVPARVPFAVYEEYYPGPLFVDAFLLDAIDDPASRDTSLKALRDLSAGQPVGVRSDAVLPKSNSIPFDFFIPTSPVAGKQE